jgi:hypothetical protein
MLRRERNAAEDKVELGSSGGSTGDQRYEVGGYVPLANSEHVLAHDPEIKTER